MILRKTHISMIGVGLWLILSPAAAQERSAGLQSLFSRIGYSPNNGESMKCGFPIASALLKMRGSSDPGVRNEVNSMLERTPLEKSIVVGGFRIHYDTSAMSQDTPSMLNPLTHVPIPGTFNAYAESVAAIANHVLEFETGVLGYSPPPSDNGAGGGNEYDIYIVKQVLNPGIAYGVTIPETQTGTRTWTTYIKVHNDFAFVRPDSNKGLPALRVTLAHEFHHAIQLGGYGLWDNDVYFYEITSTWMEDVVYTEVNDYLQYLTAQFANPSEPFTKFEFSGILQYGRCVWGHYIAKRFGRDVMRHAWEEIRDTIPLRAMDRALQNDPYLSSFRQAFAEWGKWNYFTGARADTVLYYPEGKAYPSVTPIVIGFGGIEGTLPFLASRYYNVLGNQSTFTLGLANINVEAGLSNSTAEFPYRYLMNTQQVDNTYRQTADRAYVKLEVADRTNWYDWSLGSSIVTGVAFPNPFRSDGRASMYVAVNSTAQLEGSLSIFTSSMDLVFTSTLLTRPHISGQQVFAWNGRTNNGEVIQSGVYFFVLDVPDKTYTGKFAVIRK